MKQKKNKNEDDDCNSNNSYNNNNNNNESVRLPLKKSFESKSWIDNRGGLQGCSSEVSIFTSLFDLLLLDFFFLQKEDSGRLSLS